MAPLLNQGLDPFDPNDCDGNTAQAFEQWLETLQIYCDHMLDEPPPSDVEARRVYDKQKKKKFLWFIGKQGRQDIQTLFPDGRTDRAATFNVLTQKLRQHYQPKSSRWQAIVRFRALRQEEGESVVKFADRCRQQASLCGFENIEFNEGNPLKMATKIQLVLGTTCQSLRDDPYR